METSLMVTRGYSHSFVARHSFTSFSHFSSECVFRRKKMRGLLPLYASQGTTGPSDNVWLEKLPDRSSALYAHSLPCIEVWLRSMGFQQFPEVRENWILRRPDWNAELSMDVTELIVRYQQLAPNTPGVPVERRFSYALSREDLENAILAGP